MGVPLFIQAGRDWWVFLFGSRALDKIAVLDTRVYKCLERLSRIAVFSLGLFSIARTDKVGATEPTGTARAIVALASINHACGSIEYSTPANRVTKDEIHSLRQIISFLYKGGTLTVRYPGAPEPTFNEATKKQMRKNLEAYGRMAAEQEKWWKTQVNERYGPSRPSEENPLRNSVMPGVSPSDPKESDIESELAEKFAQDPVAFHIHEGPSAGQIEDVIASPSFSKRAGKELTSLILERTQGRLGNRSAILGAITRRFEVQKRGQIVGDENCHVLDTLGSE